MHQEAPQAISPERWEDLIIISHIMLVLEPEVWYVFNYILITLAALACGGRNVSSGVEDEPQNHLEIC